MRFLPLLPNFLIFTSLALAAPQAEVTPITTQYDTGLRLDGQPVYLSVDAIGELRKAAEEGKNIESLASVRADSEHVSFFSVLEQDLSNTWNSSASGSYIHEGYSIYSEVASIARQTDSEAYRSLGASYTSDVVSSISTFYAAETGSNLTSVEIESQFEVEDEGSALRFQIPVLVLLLSTFMGASMVL